MDRRYIQSRFSGVVPVMFHEFDDIFRPCPEMLDYDHRRKSSDGLLSPFEYFAFHSLNVHLEKVEAIERQRVYGNDVHGHEFRVGIIDCLSDLPCWSVW